MRADTENEGTAPFRYVSGAEFNLSILSVDDLSGGSNPTVYSLDPTGTNLIPETAAPSRVFWIMVSDDSDK